MVYGNHFTKDKGSGKNLTAVKNLVCKEEKHMAKRGMNIYKRKDGRWEGRVRLREAREGAGKYRSVYGRSYREVRGKMALLAAEPEGRPQEGPCTLTVWEVVDRWMADRRGAWKESTYACYRQLAERHIRDGIGAGRADAFTDAAFQAFLDGIRKKSDGSRISPSYAGGIGTVLRQAFAHVRGEYGFALPGLRRGRRPGGERRADVPSEAAMGKLAAHLRRHADDPTCLGVLVASCTGIRIGELCALRWGDIDLEEGVLRVSRNMQRVRDYGGGGPATRIRVQAPKTPTSARRIPLPDALLGVLRENRRPAGEYLVCGRRRPWAEARTVQYRFAALLKRCGIGVFRFHALRHYFASHCIRQGFDIKSLSEILGHVNTQITLNLYVHSTMEQKRELMNRAF